LIEVFKKHPTLFILIDKSLDKSIQSKQTGGHPVVLF